MCYFLPVFIFWVYTILYFILQMYNIFSVASAHWCVSLLQRFFYSMYRKSIITNSNLFLKRCSLKLFSAIHCVPTLLYCAAISNSNSGIRWYCNFLVSTLLHFPLIGKVEKSLCFVKHRYCLQWAFSVSSNVLSKETIMQST